MSFSQLPGEMVANIFDRVLNDPTIRGSTSEDKKAIHPEDTREQARILRTINKMSTLAVDHCLQRRFHSFEPKGSPIVRSHITEWMPTYDCTLQEDLDYWVHHHVTSPSPSLTQLEIDLAALRRLTVFNPSSVRIDARAADYVSSYSVVRPALHHKDKWACSSRILTRLAKPNSNLKKLHLRVSFTQDICYQVEEVLRNQPQLVDLVVEADIPAAWNSVDRPTLDLDRTQRSQVQYATMDRFIIRAPGLKIAAINSDKFIDRTKSCTHFCLAVQSIAAGRNVPVHRWVQRLFANSPHLQAAEISVGEESPSVIADKTAPERCNLPRLAHLTLDLRDINASLLDRLDAPLLRYLRIRSQNAIHSDGRCQPGRFPNLLSATIDCPGFILERFNTLGLARHQYSHALIGVKEEGAFDGEVHAYIQKHHLPGFPGQQPAPKRPRING
ncbi:hypothetical protein OC835_003308 [Tilletia horrida]|uniref:Uncharacterized protein n=1 Tax=Tilletia horrida TaxID=155126 RepID=A0AAN6JH40_9BASI|nr:hypothetical protein OC842_007298 [Tilletia horrida]KAK0532510.1 hypothetical protein OC835_003308 [Tilletia horrida]